MNFFESWGAPKAPKNENGPELDAEGNVVWKEPETPAKLEMVPKGTPADVPQDAPYAEKDFIAFEAPTVSVASEQAKEASLADMIDGIDWNTPIPESKTESRSVWDNDAALTAADRKALDKDDLKKAA